MTQLDSLRQATLRHRLWLAAVVLAAVTSACVSDSPDSHGVIRLQTTLRAPEEMTLVRLRLSAGEPQEVFYDQTWRLGSAELPELPATVTVKGGRADAVHVVADALLGDFLVDRQEGELVFSDPVRSHLTLELGPRFSCGNGILDDGEECDCGVGAAAATTCPAPNNDVLPGACRTDCRLARCGDGVLDAAEACDDGNDVDEDACTSSCQVNVCGDGIPRAHRACWRRSGPTPFQLQVPFPTLAGAEDLDGDGAPEVLAHSDVVYPQVHILGYEPGRGLQQRQVLAADGQVRAVVPWELDANPGLELLVLNNAPPEVRVYSTDEGSSLFRAQPTFLYAFDDLTTTLSAWAVGHLDGDAEVDVVVALETELWLLGADGAGGLAPLPSSPVEMGEVAYSLALADANGDALADLLMSPFSRPELWLFPGDGQGGLGPKVTIPLGAVPNRLLLGTFDEDAAIDVVFVDELFRLWLYHGDGRGGFAASAWSPLKLPLQPNNLALGDVDGDGWMDLVLFEVRFGEANGVAVAFAIGQRETAPEPAMFEGFSQRLGVPAIADIDIDGDLDLLIPEADLGAGHPVHLLLNDP